MWGSEPARRTAFVEGWGAGAYSAALRGRDGSRPTPLRPLTGASVLELVLSPVILYAGLAIGAAGVYYALPRLGTGPRILGVLVAAVGAGLIMLTLTGGAGAEGRPNLFFHVFALIALGSALRVITHPRPVYAALYFILTILSSAGLYLLLSAEFLTFALVIIYAGAILITYLFVIMLATQAPTHEQDEALTGYDAVSREPALAVIIGFVLLGTVSGMFNLAVPQMPPSPEGVTRNAILADLPRKVERSLERSGVPDGFRVNRVIAAENESAPFAVLLDVPASEADRFRAALDDKSDSLAALGEHLFMQNATRPDDPEGFTPGYTLAFERLPDGLEGENLERVGLALIGQHPLALELAGVILLLAMVGAVILARKQIEIGEDEQIEAARRIRGAA